MTAGTDPEPAEPSRAVKMPSIMQISHIPYLDHNYGQPPPMTPPDSNSPGLDDVDTGNEDDERNAVTRCICGFDHDDGYMICCDKCSVWQHIECMGISSESLPDNYLCEQCEPRQLDRERAKGIQMKKKEELSDDDDDDDESAEEADGTTYTAFSSTPTRITLTAKVSQPKRKTGPKLKGDKDKEKKTKRKKRKEYTKQRIPTEFIPVDDETNDPWENNCNRVDYYQEAKECTYTPVVEEFAAKLAQTNQVRCLPDGLEQLCKVVEVQRNTKGLVATEDLYKDQFLIKVKGKMMLCSEFDEDNPMFRRYNPYVLFYNNNSPECLKLCVDARVFGNEARFIRRSCTPNAEVRHVLQNGTLNLAVFSLNPLPKGSEITIPFEFSFADYHCSLTCACAQDTCAVAKYKLKLQVSGQEMNNLPEQNGHRVCDDGSNSGHNPLLRTPLSGQNSIQGDSDSDGDNAHDKTNDSECRRKKLSREERKLEAYVKQIERLEKKEKKRQQPQKEHRQILRMSSDEGGKPHVRGVRIAKRLNHKRRSNGAASSLKKKRARISSCSSEPLSPDEVSSAASTPTTPKPVSTIPEESPTQTPSTSPSRNFRFPKAKIEENSHDGMTSALSSPTSPCSPRESETETKPTLSTASSNSDIAMAIDMEETESVRFEEQTCDNGSVDQQGDLSNDLSARLAEISNVSRSECNSPSPCPSSSASPTRSESVMNGCTPSTAIGARSPGPVPGTPLAALIHGARSTRTNPLYCSLKKRWLYKFLSGQNGVGLGRPVNGVRNLMFGEKPKPVVPVNHSAYKEPLPLKKRYLRKANSNAIQPRSVNLPAKAETTTPSFPTTNETKLNELTISTNESDKFMKTELDMQVNQSPKVVQQEMKQTRTLELDSRTLLRSQELNEVSLNTYDSSQQSYISRGILGTVPDLKPVVISTAPVQRISDPRQHSPLSSSQSSLQQLQISVASTPTSTITQSSDVSSAGTPGKKKVSLLEYRNRLQRLSGDGPKPSINPALTTPPTTTTPATTPTKPSTTSTSPSNHISNGPSVEPISPEEDERYIASRFKTKMTHSPLYEAKLNSIANKEARVNMFNKKLSALISEKLLSDPANSPNSSKSPSTASNSPSVPPPPPPPPDSAGKAGDAMDIEEDGPSDPKIYIDTPLVSSSRPQLQAPNPHTLIAEYGRPHHAHQIPDYRTHEHHPHVQPSLLTPMIQASATQLPGQISPQSSHLQTRVSASPYRLSQAVPSQIRFPASYQNPSVPNGPYYQQ